MKGNEESKKEHINQGDGGLAHSPEQGRCSFPIEGRSSDNQPTPQDDYEPCLPFYEQEPDPEYDDDIEYRVLKRWRQFVRERRKVPGYQNLFIKEVPDEDI